MSGFCPKRSGQFFHWNENMECITCWAEEKKNVQGRKKNKKMVNSWFLQFSTRSIWLGANNNIPFWICWIKIRCKYVYFSPVWYGSFFFWINWVLLLIYWYFNGPLVKDGVDIVWRKTTTKEIWNLPFFSHESLLLDGGNNFPSTAAASSSFNIELYVASISGASALVTLNRSGILITIHTIFCCFCCCFFWISLTLIRKKIYLWKHFHRIFILW